MITLDASVLIAATQPGNIHHEEAIKILSEGLSFTVHPLTLAEFLVYPARTSAKAARKMAAYLEAQDITTNAAVDVDPVDIALARANYGLKMPDACVLATALRTRSTLASFDQSLNEAAIKAGVDLLNNTAS
ncbi:MAG: PIN domain-containing protein [Actinomycetaceae bacterium]|nr:PIN domain-containing protein [Actinomycetaceae bacterium]